MLIVSRLGQFSLHSLDFISSSTFSVTFFDFLLHSSCPQLSLYFYFYFHIYLSVSLYPFLCVSFHLFIFLRCIIHPVHIWYCYVIEWEWNAMVFTVVMRKFPLSTMHHRNLLCAMIHRYNTFIQNTHIHWSTSCIIYEMNFSFWHTQNVKCKCHRNILCHLSLSLALFECATCSDFGCICVGVGVCGQHITDAGLLKYNLLHLKCELCHVIHSWMICIRIDWAALLQNKNSLENLSK